MALKHAPQWYFHGFGVPDNLFGETADQRKTKEFFNELDVEFKKDTEETYSWLDENLEHLNKIYTYIPFFTKVNWHGWNAIHDKLDIVVEPAEWAVSIGPEIGLGIRPPEILDDVKRTEILIHEMIHLNIEYIGKEFILSEGIPEIDAEELYVFLKSKEVCEYIKLEIDINFRKNIQFDKYDISKETELEMKKCVKEAGDPEIAITQLASLLKKAMK